MNRSIALGISILFIFAACAKDKNETKAAPTTKAAASSGGIASTEEMVPFAKAAPAATAKDPSKPADPVAEEKEVLNHAQIDAKNALITCKNNDCDPSVGLLSIVSKREDDWGAGTCTASLIGSDILVTNGHCIPDDLKNPGSSCKNRLWITFGDDPAHPEYDKQIRCGKVLFSNSDGSTGGSDYAYVQLEKASNRPFLRQSRSGIEDKKVYQVHKVNPIHVEGRRVAGLMEKVNCHALFDSAIFPAPLDGQSTSNLFVNCKVIPGNSGSPILAEDGTLRGVIYAYLKTDELRKNLDKNDSLLPDINALANMNMGSNFACLKEPGDLEGKNLPPSCLNQREKTNQRRAETQQKIIAELTPAAQTMIEQHKTGHAEIAAFGWNLQISESEKFGILGVGVPGCVNAPQAAGIMEQETDFHRPLFLVKATYDKYLRASNRILVWGNFSASTETIQLAQANDAYKLEISESDTGQVSFKETLAKCP